MELALICAIGRKRGIGRSGGLIWRISDDLKRFKRVTMGHPIIMGRKTHESIGCALPGRTNIVITRQAGYSAAGCVTAGSVAEALGIASGSEGGSIAFGIGGGEIFRELIGRADGLALTVVDAAAADADTWFPEYEADFEVLNEDGPFDQDGIKYRFVDLARKVSA